MTAILQAPQVTESDFRVQRQRVAALKAALAGATDPDAANLLALADFLVRRSVWIVGGDGWAYDIDSGGLDHVLAAGKDVNILVLDTEVYSNTGGQASKATPLGATAKFAAAGKTTPRKDLAMMAIAYGNVYVAQIAMGANNEQALVAMREAEAYSGTSLILAYSQCIAHGTDLRHGMKQAARAVASGYWPLFRFDPTMRGRGMNPFRLDSPRPRIPLEEYRYNEVRFKSLTQTHPDAAKRMLEQAQRGLEERYRVYEDLATRDGSRFELALAGHLIMNLATRYLGLQLAHPIVAAASPLTATLDGMRRLEDAGAAAVVMASLYEEQIRAEDTAYALYTEHGSNSQAEASSYFPELADYDSGVSGHLETLQRASEALDIPVIASLNGTTCRRMDRARARPRTGRSRGDRAEYLLGPGRSRRSAAPRWSGARWRSSGRSRRPCAFPSPSSSRPTSARCRTWRPNWCGPARTAWCSSTASTHLTSTSLTLRVTRSLPLSTSAELPLSLVWIALLSRRVACSLAASRGVETEVEVVKYLLAGADVVMTASALLSNGPQHVATMRDGTRVLARRERLRLGRRDPRPEGRDARRARRCASPRAVCRIPHRIPAREAPPVDVPWQG